MKVVGSEEAEASTGGEPLDLRSKANVSASTNGATPYLGK